MRAARLHSPGTRLRLEDVPIPEPSGTEVRVRVAGCGVCHTDLHLVDGTQSRVVLPRTLGHEVAGWIESLGPDATEPMRGAGLAEGDPVVVYGGWGCGVCRECRAGAEQRCPRSVAPGFQADGGYAEAMLVPHPRHLVALESLDPVHAAPLADAGATAHRAVARARRGLNPGARVVVVGCGGVGGFVVQLLRLVPQGTELAVAVLEADARGVARARSLGADMALLDVDAASTLEALDGPADVVVDVVGTDATLRLAADVVAPGGLVVLVGEAGGRLPFGFDDLALEAWLTTVAWGSRDDLADVVQLARAGRLHWKTEPVPLAEANAAHDRLRSGPTDGRLVLVP